LLFVCSEVDLVLGSKRVIQDGQRRGVRVGYNFIPGRDRIGQLSELISMEYRATFVGDLVLSEFRERRTSVGQ